MEIELYQKAILNGADIVLEVTNMKKEFIQTILSFEGINSITVTIRGMQNRTEDIREMIYLLKAKNKFKLSVDFTSVSSLSSPITII